MMQAKYVEKFLTFIYFSMKTTTISYSIMKISKQNKVDLGKNKPIMKKSMKD